LRKRIKKADIPPGKIERKKKSFWYSLANRGLTKGGKERLVRRKRVIKAMQVAIKKIKVAEHETKL